jgi:hypothetical protein
MSPSRNSNEEHPSLPTYLLAYLPPAYSLPISFPHFLSHSLLAPPCHTPSLSLPPASVPCCTSMKLATSTSDRYSQLFIRRRRGGGGATGKKTPATMLGSARIESRFDSAHSNSIRSEAGLDSKLNRDAADPSKNMVVIQNPDSACPDAFVIA